jgi:hypothetical protein
MRFFFGEWRGRTTRIRSEMQRREEESRGEEEEGERAQRDEIYEEGEKILRGRRVEGEVEVMSLFPFPWPFALE